MIKNKKEIEFDFGIVKQYNDNTLIIEYKPHTTITLDILKKVNKARLEILGDTFHNFIVEADEDFIGMEHEAKVAHAKGIYHGGKRMNDAVVIKGMGPKMEAALYNSSLNPIAKTKFFSSVEKAKAWIDELSED